MKLLPLLKISAALPKKYPHYSFVNFHASHRTSGGNGFFDQPTELGPRDVESSQGETSKAHGAPSQDASDEDNIKP